MARARLVDVTKARPHLGVNLDETSEDDRMHASTVRRGAGEVCWGWGWAGGGASSGDGGRWGWGQRMRCERRLDPQRREEEEDGIEEEVARACGA